MASQHSLCFLTAWQQKQAVIVQTFTTWPQKIHGVASVALTLLAEASPSSAQVQ